MRKFLYNFAMLFGSPYCMFMDAENLTYQPEAGNCSSPCAIGQHEMHVAGSNYLKKLPLGFKKNFYPNRKVITRD